VSITLPTRLLKAGTSGYMFCFCFLFICLFVCLFTFSHLCQISYLEIYFTDLHQIFTVGRTMTVEDQSENSFSIPQAMLPRQPIFVGLVHTTVFVTPVV